MKVAEPIKVQLAQGNGKPSNKVVLDATFELKEVKFE
jgi:hypothetical protein